MLDERQYQPRSQPATSTEQPRGSGITVAEPRRQHAGQGQQGTESPQSHEGPSTHSGSGDVRPMSPGGHATTGPSPAVTPDRAGQRTPVGAGGSGCDTPGVGGWEAESTPISLGTEPPAAAGEAMLTPNAHAMNAEQAALLRKMLHEISPGRSPAATGAAAAAVAASPVGSPARALRVADALACGDTVPQRRLSLPAAAGLSAVEIQKMRGMLQQALASPPPGSADPPMGAAGGSQRPEPRQP